jgi:hypothetical protein
MKGLTGQSDVRQVQAFGRRSTLICFSGCSEQPRFLRTHKNARESRVRTRRIGRPKNLFPKGDRRFESPSLQQRVSNEPGRANWAIDPPGLGQAFEPNCDVYAIAKDVAILDDDVAHIDPNPTAGH